MCVHVSVKVGTCVCVCAVTLNLQENPLRPGAVWIPRIRKEEAAGHQQEHDHENWTQTSQDPLCASYQVDEMQLRQIKTNTLKLNKSRR